MQISNPAISQFLSGTINRAQQPDRFPVKSNPTQSAPIEGQLVDDKKTPSEANNVQESGFSQGLEQSENGSQTQLIAPTNAPQITQTLASEHQGGQLLIQKKLSSNPVTVSQNDSSSAQNFPFGNRRSLEGISGGSLVIQKYLSNESTNQTPSGNSQRNIDVFI